MPDDSVPPPDARPAHGASRRSFLGRIGATTAVAIGFPLIDAAPAAASGTRDGAPVPPDISSSVGGGAMPRAEQQQAAHAILGRTAAVLDGLTLDAFARHLHSTFRIHGAGGPVDVELIEASSKARPPQDRQRCFAVLFRGPAGQPLEQGTYRLEHPALGAFDLLVVPVGPTAGAPLYEVVFNRLPD